MLNAIEIVRSILVGNAGVSALVGSSRVYPLMAPQNSVLPNLVVTQISDNDPRTLSGQAQYPETRVSVVSRGSTVTEMMNLADAVKLALRDITHQTISVTTPSGSVSAPGVCVYKTAVDITSVFDDPISYEQSVDFMVRWRNTAP